jgi:NAD(P)H-quinone oxidoreductase subunit 5
MGFMIMQCGLGFFNAAVVHLLLHGFIKPTYFYLQEKWGIRNRKTNTLKSNQLQAIIVLFFGILGAFLFI